MEQPGSSTTLQARQRPRATTLRGLAWAEAGEDKQRTLTICANARQQPVLSLHRGSSNSACHACTE
eukprot:8676598-Lingulodinium_polyedra.AAC.1